LEESVNKKGHPQTLQAKQFGNANARRHGVTAKDQSPRPRALEIAEELMLLSHVGPNDWWIAVETGRVCDLIERIDADIEARELFNAKGEIRSIVDLRLRFSRRLERLLEQLIATPRARATFELPLAQAALADALNERRQRREDGHE
jgi:hypothetical protein